MAAYFVLVAILPNPFISNLVFMLSSQKLKNMDVIGKKTQSQC